MQRNSTRMWQAHDRHHMHPFTHHSKLNQTGSRIIVSADGNYLKDSEGQVLLDGFAGLWCVNVGYGRASMIEAAARQMQELAYYNTFFHTSHPAVAELSELLVRITPPQFNHVFYGQSGSDANDTIARMIRVYWNLRKKPKKKTIISRNNAYHGSTLAAASMGGMRFMQELADLPLPGFDHIRQPYWYGEGGDSTPAEFGRIAARALEEKILELGPENVGGFIGEPIQGAGGIIFPPDSYWPEIQAICRKYDVLIVADEVISGFGRTGHWFASEKFGIEADFMTLAKGLTSGYMPLSAVMVGDRVADILTTEGEFNHGYTYSGHPVACAVAIENIRILESEGLVGLVRETTGPYLAKRLRELDQHELVGETRSLGLLAAIELAADKTTRKPFPKDVDVGTICRNHCLDLGLILRAKDSTMLLSPPLTWTSDHIDAFMAIFRKALDLTAQDVARRRPA